MSGAGSLGAYQASVFLGLVNLLPDEDMSYDVITGVSAGSLNALGLSGFSSDQLSEAANFIYALWNSADRETSLKTWPGGFLAGLFQKGLFNNDHSKAWLAGELGDRGVKKKVTFSSINANTGQYVNLDFNESETRPDFLIEAAFASSAIPGLYPHIHHEDMELVDGGTVWNLDLDSPIRRCKEIVDKDEDIIVDFIIVSAATIEDITNFNDFSPQDHFLRGQQISSFYNVMNDYNSSIFNYPNIDFRYTIFPSEKLSNGPIDIIKYDQSVFDRCFSVGQKDAKTAVELGPGVTKDVLLEYFEKYQKGQNVNINDMMKTRLQTS